MVHIKLIGIITYVSWVDYKTVREGAAQGYVPSHNARASVEE